MSQKVTGYNLVSFINQLDKSKDYNYVGASNKSLIRIISVTLPGGPIRVKRWDPSKKQTADSAKTVSISKEMIWRIANAFFEEQPISFDRILGGSYNTRSVLESLIAHTPQFYYCYPGRIKDIAGKSSIERGHKHIVWLPSEPHENGVMLEKKVDVAISEIPTSAAVYEALTIPDEIVTEGIDVEVARRHTQIQIAIYLIGLQLGYRTWIAQNDLGIRYQDKPLIEQEGIVRSLQNENTVAPFEGAVSAGKFIDCIWFKNGRLMPAIMEVEHSTGITSGLTRMLKFSQKIPPIQTRYVIVAPDEDRERVIEKANESIFRELDIRFFPYSAVEELYVICQRRKLRGVTEEFLDCYMERVLVP